MIQIYTDNYKRYRIDENLCITGGNCKVPSEGWRLKGICLQRYNRIQWFSSYVSALIWFNLYKNELLYKNGKCKYHIIDFDHGAVRVWGEGIKEVLIYEDR